MQEQKSMVSERKLAHAVGGKSVRACDNCVKKRARWYCAADDAFLCDSCDSSVHSANPLARRHERVRLKISSSKGKQEVNKEEEEEETSSFPFDDEVIRVDVPSWQKGFTRKARTPRQKKSNFPTHIVPEQEACSEDDNDSEEQLLYRVPVFDVEKNYGQNGNFTQDQVNDLLPSELDLAEFAADVESLLGKGLEDEAFDMEGLGIFDCGDIDDHRDDVDQGKDFCLRNNIKDEENLLQFDDFGRETFELNFDCGVSPIMYEEEEEEENKAQVQENKALLKLDYDRVMSAWDYRKSPWMTGQRPEFNSGDWWPDYYSGTSGIMHAYKGDVAMPARGGGGGREARVSRYREKRRTRLFSKKIRYEVRKLNAEKRPRMKGRFVKRASFAATAFPLHVKE